MLAAYCPYSSSMLSEETWNILTISPYSFNKVILPHLVDAQGILLSLHNFITVQLFVINSPSLATHPLVQFLCKLGMFCHAYQTFKPYFTVLCFAHEFTMLARHCAGVLDCSRLLVIAAIKFAHALLRLAPQCFAFI